MKSALLSDIHGNEHALRAVLEDIDAHGEVGRIFCLGDIVGYGARPEACIDLVAERCELTLLGNHDYALVTSADGFNPVAASAITCLRGRLRPGVFRRLGRRRRWRFLQTLPERHRIGRDVLVHASPRDSIYEYILPEDTVYFPDKLQAIFRLIERNVFVGHTHRPGVIDTELRFRTPEEVGMRWALRPGERNLVNIGSTGQPRDHDPRASYAIVDDGSVEWRRVEYDVEAAVRAVLDDPCLDDRNGLRLREGR